MPLLTDSLHRWLAEGRSRIGEIAITPTGSGYTLCHFLDLGRDDLTPFSDPDAALELARYDGAGQFRPLKSAPNLKRGWKLELASLASLGLALDHFYPAAVGTAAAWEKGAMTTVPLSETIQRQTGMYRVVNKLTTGQRDDLAAQTCRSDIGCLKTICWQLASDVPITKLPGEKFDPAINQTGEAHRAIPILCAEACNLLIAAGRTMAKANK